MPRMETSIINHINVDLIHDYPNLFSDGQRLAILDHASYLRLLDLLTPDQRAALNRLAADGLFTGLTGYVA